MTKTEMNKLNGFVAEGKLSIGSIGVYLYLILSQGDIMTYQKISDDLRIGINTVKKHIRRMVGLKIILRSSQRRGVIFTIRPYKNWVASDYSYIHTPITLYKEEIREILEHLSLKAKHTFNASDSTKDLIRARLNAGYTVKDFKKVHQNKSDWLSSAKMHKFYRPATLYTKAHFSDYLEEIHRADSAKQTTSKWKDDVFQNEIKKTKLQLADIDDYEIYDEEDLA